MFHIATVERAAFSCIYGMYLQGLSQVWIFVFLLSSFGFSFQVCATEGANIQPHLLERLVGSCHGDIRKVIMHLQFWCQGKIYKEGQLHNTCMLAWHLYACYCFLYSYCCSTTLLLLATSIIISDCYYEVYIILVPSLSYLELVNPPAKL